LVITPSAPADDASLPVTLSATPLTLDRTASVTVQLILRDGSAGQLAFTAAEIAAGEIEKTYQGARWDDVEACSATWAFRPREGDVVPRDALSVDNAGFDCAYNTASKAVEITPLTAVQPLTIVVPAAALAARGATALSYTLNVAQMHGPAWTYNALAATLVADGGDVTVEYALFTGGCLSYELTPSWQRPDGSVVQDPLQSFMGESYTGE
jgi:hypothetical protein